MSYGIWAGLSWFNPQKQDVLSYLGLTLKWFNHLNTDIRCTTVFTLSQYPILAEMLFLKLVSHWKAIVHNSLHPVPKSHNGSLDHYLKQEDTVHNSHHSISIAHPCGHHRSLKQEDTVHKSQHFFSISDPGQQNHSLKQKNTVAITLSQ